MSTDPPVRQARLIVALLLLLCVGAALVWYLVSRGGGGVNAPAACASATDPGESQPLAAGNPRATPAGDSRQPAANSGENPKPGPGEKRATGDQPGTDQPAPGEWLMRGKVAFDSSVPYEIPQLFNANGYPIHITFLPDEGDGEPLLRRPKPAPDGAFRDTFADENIPFPLRDGALPPGRWQLVCNVEGNVKLLTESAGDELPGMVQPVIDGRIIDFGTVTLGVDAVFGDVWLITGRVVHSSGTPLRHVDEVVLSYAPDQECMQMVITDSDGRFLVPLPPEGMRPDPTTWRGRLFNGLEGGDQAMEAGTGPGEVRLGTPAVKGRRVDYGDIVVSGAVVEVKVEVEGWKPQLTPGGKLPMTPWTDYPGVYAEVTLESLAGTYTGSVYPGPFPTALWLPEGRYHYTAEAYGVQGQGGTWSSPSGTVNAADGQVAHLSLKLHRYNTIPLDVETDGKKPDQLRVKWTAFKGGARLDSNTCYGAQHVPIPVLPGAETRVVVHADGFEEAVATARPGDKQLLVKLEAVARPRFRIVVTVPALPPGLRKLRGGRRLVAMTEDGQIVASLPNPGHELNVPLGNAGTYLVELRGGALYGYPGGVLSGPVKVVVTAGEPASVTLPDITPPPWNPPAGRFLSKVTCANGPISLDTRVYVGQDERTTFAALATGQHIKISAPPVAIPDGDQRVPLKIKPPKGKIGSAVVVADLPCRIEVRASRRGEKLTGFTARATPGETKLVRRSGQTFSEAKDVDGTARLWLPVGTATVAVVSEGHDYTRTLDVKRGEVARVDFDIDDVRVEFKLPNPPEKPQDAPSEVPPPWLICKLTAAGRDICGKLDSPATMLLEPAHYEVVPGYGDTSLAVDLDLSDGADRTVTLPALPRLQLTDVRLKFDTAAFGDAWLLANISYVTADQLQQPNHRLYWTSLTTRNMPDGIKLLGVPAGSDVVLVGTLVADLDGVDTTWVLNPLRARIRGDGEVLTASWTKALTWGNDWAGLDAYCCSALPGLYLPLSEMQHPLPGRGEYAFLDRNRKVAVREWANIPDDPGKPVDIPAELRRALVEKGLLEDG